MHTNRRRTKILNELISRMDDLFDVVKSNHRQPPTKLGILIDSEGVETTHKESDDEMRTDTSYSADKE